MPNNHLELECPVCSATGIQVTEGDRFGLGTVCSRCQGKGFIVQKIRLFSGRKRHPSCQCVIRHNFGVVLSPGIPGLGEIPYEDWLRGKSFPEKSEVRLLSCPKWYYETLTGNPDWAECVKDGQMHHECERFSDKHKCWERFDQEAENG